MIGSKFFNVVLNFFYPPKCIFCRNILDITAERPVCEKCYAELPYLENKVCCEKCGKPIVSFGKRKLCYHCLNQTHFYYKRIVSVFEYEGHARDSILRYKTNNTLRLYAKVYAEMMYKRFLQCFANEYIDIIVAVPDSKARGFQKTAGHVDLICEEFSKLSGIPFYKNCLKKVKHTAKQASLKWNERQTNLIGSIKATDPEKLKGKTCILIDDVCTTRATIRECSKELKFAGCKKILALTLCTTVKKPIRRKDQTKPYEKSRSI